MNLFEIALANCITATHLQDKRQRLGATTPTKRSIITRLTAIAVVLSVAILALDTAGERYEQQLAIAVAATRQ